MRLALLTLALAAIAAAQPKVITPAGAAKPVGPYSPALDTGAYVYVSGQGVRDAAGAMPNNLEAQTRQCLANVRANLEAAGLELHDVAASQLYLADLADLPTVERLWSEHFGGTLPPRITLGVTNMPTGTTIEITVVARRTPGDRVYLNALYGQSRRETEQKLNTALKKARLARKNVALATWYNTEAPQPGVITVAFLPDQAKWAVSAIAARSKESNTAYCEMVASTGAGTIEQQTDQAFANLKTCLAKQGATLADVVVTNVYLDDINNFAKMNAAYAPTFTGTFPTRTTVQPVPPTHSGPAVRLSAIAEKR